MTSPRIDPAKLRVPGLTQTPLRRTRLTERLDAHPGRLIAVVAPAGFGKTVLVVDWLARHAGPWAWVSLDPLDEEPTRLAEHLAEAVRRLAGDGDAGAAAVGAALRQVAAGESAGEARLRDALGDLDTEAVLVLDDLHRLDAPASLALVGHLVHAPHSRLRVVLVSRTDPPLALARLRLSGELLEVRARELAFDLQEARALFATGEGAGARLTDADLDALVARTEGWPAGLRLAEISLKEADDPHAFVRSFAGTHRFVTDYLLEEALGRQSRDLQRFLMESAVLDRFDAELCRRVLGDAHAARRLDEVRAAGLFLVPLGSGGRWYRYHHLFGELLTHRLATADPERHDALLHAASAAAEARGEIEPALEYAGRMRGDARLLALLDAHGLALLGRSAVAGLRRWLAGVDLTHVRPYPLAWCADAWLRVVTERVGDPAPLVARIEAALDQAGPDYEASRREQARMHTHILSAYAARYRHRWAEALAAGEAAHAISPRPEPMSRGFLIYNTARVRMALGQMRAADELLTEALAHHLASGNRYLLLATLGRQVAVALQERGVGGADEALDAADAFIAEHGLRGNPAGAIVEFHRGWTHLAAHRLERATGAFDAALELADARDFPEERGNALMGRLRVCLARKAFARAEDHLTELTSLSHGGNVDLFESTLELERARLALGRAEMGPGNAAPPCARLLELAADDGHWTVLRESAALLALRAALGASGEAHAPHAAGSDALAALADQVVARARAGGRGEALVAGLLAQALTRSGSARTPLLAEARETAQQRGTVAALHAMGPAGLAVLGTAHVAPSPAPMAAEPGSPVTRAPGPSAPGVRQPDPLLTTLTAREAEILGLLFEGLSNKSLSRRLFVSVDTVKTHLKHIYAKLGVTSRARAVARARELGFMPPSGG